ncbi:MAG TPA: N-acetylmuramoyl-L-alanine amidase [Terriglobales bacterium]|nr:N-acetylmuramoyl-L-alanine amidase [Terriglobales bacterium]
MINFLKVILIFICLILLYSFSHGSTITIEKGDQKYDLEGLEINNYQYIEFTGLKEIYGGEFLWNPARKLVSWQVKEHQFRFNFFSPYIVLDQDIYNLTLPVEFKNGKVYLPFKTFWPVLEIIEPPEELVRKQSGYNILDVRVSQKLNGLLIDVYLSQALNYEVFKSENNWIIINFLEGKIDTTFFSNFKIADTILGSKAYQFKGSAQLSLQLFRDFPKFYYFFKSTPDGLYRLQINLEDTASTQAPPSENDEPDKNPIDVIIIDPGHGGENFGAVGPKGTKEKDIVLDIGLRVEKLLKNSNQKGLQIYLTRRDDKFIPLEDRALFANQKGGDLFVSIHANAAKRRTASGTEIYFLAQAKNDEARAVEALENSAILFERPQGTPADTSELNFILMDMLQTEFLKESSDLAQIIHDRMKQSLNIPSRGVDQAGFFVLNKTYMPSVLVETAFISNPEEEALLNKSTFRQKIAEAICQGILDFKNKYEGKGK